MIHELIDPKKKTKKTRSSRNTKSIIPTKLGFEETSVEGSENSKKDSSSTVFISPWIRNSLGGKQKNNLSRNTVSPTDLKPIKISLGRSYQSDVDNSYKANADDDFYAKTAAHLELFAQDHIHELRCSQESEEVRVFDFCHDDHSGETSRKKCPSAEGRHGRNDNLGLPTANTVNGDLSRIPKTIRQKNKPRRRLPVTSRPADITQHDIEMALLLEMKARKALDSYMRAANRSASSDGKLLANETQHLEQEISNQVPNGENVTPKTDGTKQISVKNPDGVREGERVNKKELPRKDEKSTKETPQENDKCKKETLVEDEKPTKEVPQKIESPKEVPQKIESPKEVPQKIESPKEVPQKIESPKEVPQKIESPKEVPQNIETPKEPPKITEEERERKRLTEFLTSDKEEEDEETKCLEEVKKFLERKKRTRQTRHRFYKESSPIPEPDNPEDVPKEKLKLYRVKGSNIVPCSENVVGKAVDEALQKFVEIYHFHVSHGVMESMKKDIMRALTTESGTTSCTKLSKDEKDISNFPEFEEKDFEILKNDRLINKEPPPGDLNLCKDVMKKTSSSSTSLRKEFETFLNFIRTHIDVSNLKVRNIILEEKEKKDSSEKLQFVCNFAKKEVLRVRQHKQEETQTAESENQKKSVKLQVFETKDATCDKNLQTVVHEQTQTTPEPPIFKKSVKLQVFESKSLTCDKSQETEVTNCYYKATQTDQPLTTISEIKSLRRCNIKPGLYRLIKSKEAGKFFLYQEHNQGSQELVREDSEGSVVKDKKYSTELRSQPSKERTRERNVFFEGKEKIKKKKKNKQKKKKSEDGKKDSIDYLYFRDFDKKDSESSLSGLGDLSNEKMPVRGEEIHDDQSGGCWLWDGERISPGCDLKSQVENLVVEKLTQMCNMWYNTNDITLNTTNQPKEGEETLHRTISERTFDVASFKDIGDQSPTQMEEKWPSKKEENSECEDMLYYGREDSLKSVETPNVDWKFVSQYLPKLRDFGKKSGSRRKHSRRNSVPRSTSQKLDRLREAEELLLTVEKLKEINVNLNKDPISDGDATGNDSTSTSGNKTAPVEVPLLTVNNSDIQQFSNSESQRRWDKTIALTDRETDPENLSDLNVAENQENGSVVVDRRKQMELMGNVFSGFKRHEKENLWRHIRKFIKKKIRRDLNSADSPGEVCIEIEQEIPENSEGMNPSIMGNNDCAQFEGEFEVEVDLTLEDLERILNHRRKKMKRRSSYRNRHLKSSSSTHSDHKDNLQVYHRYLRRFGATGNELVERSPNAF